MKKMGGFDIIMSILESNYTFMPRFFNLMAWLGVKEGSYCSSSKYCQYCAKLKRRHNFINYEEYTAK